MINIWITLENLKINFITQRSDKEERDLAKTTLGTIQHCKVILIPNFIGVILIKYAVSEYLISHRKQYQTENLLALYSVNILLYIVL